MSAPTSDVPTPAVEAVQAAEATTSGREMTYSEAVREALGDIL